MGKSWADLQCQARLLHREGGACSGLGRGATDRGGLRPEVLLPGEGRLRAVRAACGVLAVQVVCAGADPAGRFAVVRPGALQRHALCKHSLFIYINGITLSAGELTEQEVDNSQEAAMCIRRTIMSCQLLRAKVPLHDSASL